MRVTSQSSTRYPESGFTLIELLVVIAIMALLIGILLPSLGAANRTAKAVEELAAARSLMQAMHTYAHDHAERLMPSYLTAQQAKDVVDEFGQLSGTPVSQRWAYRLGPYFDYQWAGTTHVGVQGKLLRDFEETIAAGGTASWTYLISVFPSLGMNRVFVGGDETDPAPPGLRRVVERIDEAFDPGGLITFASARFRVTGLDNDGYLNVSPPPLGAVYDEDPSTSSPTTAFGHVHLRHDKKAVVGWLDGRATLASEEEMLDRRNWADQARRADDPDWERAR